MAWLRHTGIRHRESIIHSANSRIVGYGDIASELVPVLGGGGTVVEFKSRDRDWFAHDNLPDDAALNKFMDLKQTLQALEERLLNSAVRKDAQEVSALLHPEFREFGSSGRIYSKAEIIDHLRSEIPTSLSLSEFEVQPIGTEAVLATYRSVQRTPESPATQSLRSSIWVFAHEHWQMLFHQGTKMPHSTPIEPVHRDSNDVL